MVKQRSQLNNQLKDVSCETSFIFSIIHVMNKNIKLVSEIAIFSAIIIVLQVLATFINFGSFPITLTLIPIIVGGAVYGPAVGLILGTVFGIIVDIMVLTGADPSGAIMLSQHPVITLATCLIKGGLAGLISALSYKYLNKLNDKPRLIISSALCPIINTLVFFISLILFFDSNIKALIGAFLSINFIIELLINILIAPYLTNLIKHYRK